MITLMPNCGFLSETSRLLAIAAALRERGEEVVIASHGGPYAHLLGAPGTDWVPLEPRWDDGAGQDRFLTGLLSWGITDQDMYDQATLRESIAAEARFLREVDAELVHIGFTLSAYVSARLAGVPLSTSHVGSFVDPVLHAGLAPAPANPPRAEMAKLPQWVQRRLANLVPRLLRRPAAQLNTMAREFGVAPIEGLMGLMGADLVLVTELPDLLGLPPERLAHWRGDWTSRWRRRSAYRYTGPLFAKLDLPIPEDVSGFLATHETVVLVSLSSASTDLIRGAVASARAAGAAVLVAATVHDLADLAGPEVCVAGILPNHLVMARVAACIAMGGQGTVQTALATGTPLLGLPLHGEQELNVAVAERQGAAIRLSPATAGTPTMERAVRALLEDPSYASAAARAASRYAGVDGAGLAAAAILGFLDTRRQDQPVRHGSRTVR